MHEFDAYLKALLKQAVDDLVALWGVCISAHVLTVSLVADSLDAAGPCLTVFHLESNGIGPDWTVLQIKAPLYLLSTSSQAPALLELTVAIN